MDGTHHGDVPPGRRSESGLLARAARWAEDRAELVGPVLAAYRRTHGLDDTTLADRLECDLNRLRGLALCRRPSPAADSFTTDVERLAAYVHCNTSQLRALLGQGAPA